MTRAVLTAFAALGFAACGSPDVQASPPSGSPQNAPLAAQQEQALIVDLATYDVVVIGYTEGDEPHDHLIVEEVLRVPPNVRLSNRVPFTEGVTFSSDGRMVYAYSLSEPRTFSLQDLDTKPHVEAMIRRELLGD